MHSDTGHSQSQASSPPEALTALDERLEEALRAAGVGAFELDLSDGSLRLSRVIGPLYGLEPGEGPLTLEEFFRDRCHPDDRARLEHAIEMLLESDVPVDVQFRALTRDGDARLLDGHARAVRDEAGTPLRLVGVIHDAGDVGERRFRDLADSAPVLMWATGADTRQCTFFNAAYLNFTGRSLEEELGEGWRDLVHPDDQQIVREADERAIDGRAPFEARYRLRRHDGVYRWVLDTGMPVYGPDGTLEGLVGGMLDLHDLIEREVLLDGIFASTPLGLALFGPDVRYRRVNEAYAAITGLSVGEHEGQRIEDVVPGIAAEATSMLEQVMRTREPAHGVVVTGRTGAEGIERRLIASYIPLVIPGGELVGLAAVVLDDTQRYRGEERRAELLQRLTLLVDASAVLDESLDADHLMSELAELLVERFAEACEAVLGDDTGGATGRTASRADRDPRHPVPEPADPDHLVIAPIIARGRDLGALRLLRSADAPPFTDEDFALAAEIGRRAGLALDNAQLVREARASELSAEESRSLLEALLEHAPVGFAYFDRDLRFVAVNRSLAEINGVPAEEHVGRRVDEVLPDMDPRVRRDLEEVLNTGRAMVDVELSGETPRYPGRTRHFLASYYRVRIPGGDALGLGATVTEVTRRRIAEDELRAQRDLYETLLRAQSEAGEAFVLFFGDRIAYANEAAERLTGRSVDELRALESYLELVPRARHSELVESMTAMVSGEDQQTAFETEIQRPDGSIAAVEIAARALRSGRGIQLVVLGRDVTERKTQELERERLLAAERAARREIEAAHVRAGFLAEISAITERSLHLRNTLREVSELIVRDVADVVAIDVIPRRGDQLERLAVGALDGSTRRVMRRTLGHVRTFDQKDPTVDVARTGRANWVNDAAAQPLEHGAGLDELDDKVLRATRLLVSALVPLIARGSVVGVLSLGWQTGRPEPGGAERELIDDLARRIALWIDNVQLYDERAQVASTLQTALLPPELPVIPGLELAARYLPADEASEVGGDFYDVFPAGEGWAIVVGDVCGKGASAAAATALARYTLRAAFIGGATRPAEGFELLERAMLGDGEPDRFLTAVLGTVTPAPDGAFSLCIARAGHPDPIILRADGRRETIGADGGVVGIALNGGWEEQELILEPGDALLLYTDGVSEADRHAPLEPDELAAAMPALAARDAEALAGAMAQIALERGEGRLRDDVAVIALRVTGKS